LLQVLPQVLPQVLLQVVAGHGKADEGVLYVHDNCADSRVP
jgi:hypothetical protein